MSFLWKAFQAVPEDLFLKGEVQDVWARCELGEMGCGVGPPINGLNGFAWDYKPLRLDLFLLNIDGFLRNCTMVCKSPAN